MSQLPRVMIGLFLLCVVQCGGMIVAAWNGILPGVVPLTLAAASFAVLSAMHAIWRHGFGHALVLIVATISSGLAVETIGVTTGVPFGRYDFGEELGWKIFGLVPAVVPVAWFLLTYNTYVFADVLLGTFRRDPRTTTFRSAALCGLGASLLGAAAMTAWDLGIEDLMVDRNGWRWPDGGWYFGIPLHNFSGWFATAFAMHVSYRLFDVVHPTLPPGGQANWCSHLPVGVYALIWTTTVGLAFAHPHHGPAWVGLFGMGSFLAAYVMLLWQRSTLRPE